MPATKQEIKEAKEDDVKFDLFKAPLEITEHGIKVACTENVIGEDGRVSTKILEGKEEFIECDSVIIAVSQSPRSNIVSNTTELDKLEKNQKILALNASIEAARAGEVGRGFAIVANKVGSLAADFGSCNREIRDELERLTDAMGEITGHKLQ